MVAPLAGPAAAPLRLAESWTTSPMVAFRVVPLVAAVSSCRVVARVGEFLPTTRTSLQGLVAPLLFESPELTACQLQVPALSKVFPLATLFRSPVVKVLMVGVWLLAFRVQPLSV